MTIEGGRAAEEAAADGAKPRRPRRDTGRRLRGAVANKLGAAIVSGEYAPGDRLESEVAFSEMLNVSRGAFREAMQVLAGLVTVLCRSLESLRLVQGDRRDDQAQ